MSRKRKKYWRYSAGEHGSKVEVSERDASGMLYARVWDPKARAQIYISLGHRDRDRAMQYAHDEAEKLRDGRSQIGAGIVTFGFLVDEYVRIETPKKKNAKSRKDDVRRSVMWKKLIGAETRASHVTLDVWESFVPKRRSGELDAYGVTVRIKLRVPVGEQAVAHDGRFLRSVYYWGMRRRTKHGGTLVSFNPFAAPAPGVKSAFELPKNPSPKRPISSDERFEKVRAAAEHVLMRARSKDSPTVVLVATKARRNYRTEKIRSQNVPMERSYLPELLDLHWETGHRRGAILDLRYHDLVWQSGAITAIRWRPVKHDEQAETIPVSTRARDALERIIAARPGIGALPLFPAFEDRTVPMSAKTADEWLHEAEEIAQVGHLDGGRWHPYRRAWATKRKPYPDVDVAKAGGWKDLATMKRSYQQSDDLTLVAVIENPRRLEERKA